MTDSNLCIKCDKTFSSKCNLTKHQKNSISCGSGANCLCCSKNFTSKKSLEEHMSICVVEKIKNFDEMVKKLENELVGKDSYYSEKLKEQECLFNKKLKEQEDHYDRLICAETVSKEKIRSEARIKETIHKEQITKLEKMIEGLHEKIEKLAATRPVSTVNNINSGNTNNITLNMFITPEFVKTQAAQFLTYDHFANGFKGLANFIHEYVLMDKSGKLVYACYDKARHILRYKDDQGNEIDDVDAEKLIMIVSQPIKDKHTKICKELTEDIERYKRILDDEDESRAVKKETKEKLDKAELSLRVMKFQSEGVNNIGMSNQKQLSRALEKVCLLPKVSPTL